MKKCFFAAVAVSAMATCAEVPEVTNATMVQSTSSRLVTITYTLENAPAVVTLDVETNITGTAEWASIGGKAVCTAEGDVWKKVGSSGVFNGTITWRPDLSWPDHKIESGGARAVVTAWSLDNPPDYVVVDISDGSSPNTETYYPGVEFLPGGILSNDTYRTTKIVMRKIMAKGVHWTMGSTTYELGRDSYAEREGTHQVALTNNYYIGVFEITQSQWSFIQTENEYPSDFQLEDKPYKSMLRPVEKVSYNEIRNSDNAVANTAYNWPAEPNPASFLGLLRTKTGIAFDLPSEAQWEFAARSGHGSPKWGDGSFIISSTSDSNLNRLGRNRMNGGYPDGTTPPSNSCGPEYGTAFAGSYAPNDWGLYDMHGNVWEWCLDWAENDIGTVTDSSGEKYMGRVNINPSNPEACLSGNSPLEGKRLSRGGSWSAQPLTCRSAYRGFQLPSTQNVNGGFRVMCPVSFK